MKITKTNDVPAFQPVVITIRLESPDEVQALKDFAYYAQILHKQGEVSQERLNRMVFLHNYLCSVAYNHKG